MGALTAAAHRRYPVRVAEDVGVLRRAMTAAAARLPELPEGDAELVGTELATNILRHTGGGYVLSRTAGAGIELIAVDHGPGMPPGGPAGSPRRAGGLGVGLAGVRRRASAFDLHSTPRGTVVLARLQPVPPAGTGPWRWGGVNVPFGGSGDSGDAWAVAAGGQLVAMIVDGLGHGPEAAAAAQAAVAVFDRQPPTGEQLADFTRRAHEAMRRTRGGVLGIGVIDPSRGRMAYAGVGNVAGRVLIGPHSHHLLSQHGTLGTHLAPPRAHSTTYPWEAGATLILASDGLDTRWDPAGYPGLLRHDPAVVAATLHRDHARNNDDAAVLVVQDTRSPDQTGGDP